MDFRTIQAIWTEQSGGGPAMGNDELIATMLKKDRTMARKVKLRDYLELITAIAMAAGLAFVATQATTAWPWVLAALVTLAVGGVFVRERRRQPGVSTSGRLRERLAQALSETDHQIRLLESVLWWYLVPLAIVAAFIVIGGLEEVRLEVGLSAWERARGPMAIVLVIAALWVGSVFGFVYWLNQRAVRRQLRPHRDALAALVHELDTNGAEGSVR